MRRFAPPESDCASALTNLPANPPRVGGATLTEFAERAISRAAGAAALEGNAVWLLRDAAENYPAWKKAIAHAQQSIFFECYIVEDDAIGREFAALLTERARAGVSVSIIVDWLGSCRALSLWREAREAGADVRVFNPPHLASPLGWLSRDHRKTIVVDGRSRLSSAGFAISERWLGDPERRLEPWRDTGIEIRGPAIGALEHAFAQVFGTCGPAARCVAADAPGDDRARRRHAPARDRQRTRPRGHVPDGSRHRVDRTASSCG